LEATLDEGIEIHVHVNATKDLGMQTHVEGQENSSDTLHKQLIKYLGRQQNIT
jgi:cold shock CspA family protein